MNWRHKPLKNTKDPLLFYREHFYGFSESDYENVKRKKIKKKIDFTRNISTSVIYIYMAHRHFEVSWSFILSLTNSHNAYIPPYMHKTLPIENENEE